MPSSILAQDISVINPGPRLRPVETAERVQLLDVLRGFAIFGILLANMFAFSGYMFAEMAGADLSGYWGAAADGVVTFLIHVLVDGKFYSLFSFLFGIGFAVQMLRAQEKGFPFVPLFARRLLVLLLLGLAHAIFLWPGDILSIYAFVGFFLLLFRNASDRVLLIGAMVLLALPVVQYSTMVIISLQTMPVVPDPAAEAGRGAFFGGILRAFGSGSYGEILEANVGILFGGRYPDLIFTGRFFKVLAMFLVGFYVGRKRIFEHLPAYVPLFRRVAGWGLALGLAANLGMALLIPTGAYYGLQPLGILESLAYAGGVPALCLFYVAGISLLHLHPAWRSKLAVFAPVGRMALSNYLLQTVVCLLIFYSFGLGFMGRVGVAGGTLLAIGIYALQIPLSALWLRHFRYGPAEWLWRTLTYGRLQPFRRPVPTSTPTSTANDALPAGS
jgi:uncharacterized protein